MKNKIVNAPIFAFVDIETTDSNFEHDRITEIGIKMSLPLNHESLNGYD